MVWGPVADRFGRVRTLMFTILCYSVFTLACAFVTNIWQLAAFRLLAGIGIGVELVTIDAYIAELMPREMRGRAFAFNAIVQALIADIITPLIAAIFHQPRDTQTCPDFCPSAAHTAAAVSLQIA